MFANGPLSRGGGQTIPIYARERQTYERQTSGGYCQRLLHEEHELHLSELSMLIGWDLWWTWGFGLWCKWVSWWRSWTSPYVITRWWLVDLRWGEASLLYWFQPTKQSFDLLSRQNSEFHKEEWKHPTNPRNSWIPIHIGWWSFLFCHLLTHVFTCGLCSFGWYGWSHIILAFVLNNPHQTQLPVYITILFFY